MQRRRRVTARVIRCGLILVACALLLGAPGARALVPAVGKSIVIVTQSVSGAGVGLVSSLSARVASAHRAGDELSLDVSGQSLGLSGTLPQLEVRDYGSSITLSQLLAAAKATLIGDPPAVAGAIDRLVPALRALLVTSGASAVMFQYSQRVAIAGAGAPKVLSWSVLLSVGQPPAYADPVVLDTQATILHVSYTGKRVAAGLPPGWAAPDAGVVKWRLLDATFTPVSAWTRVNVAGAYDEPADRTGVAVDPDAGLRCLISRSASPSCPAAITVAVLMNQTASVTALVDYGRSLQPVYDTLAPAAPGGASQRVARASMSIDVRSFAPSGCLAGIYRNAGTVGFELRAQTDRYGVSLPGTVRLMNSYVAIAQSPTAPFDVSATVSGVSVAALETRVIDISNPSGPLLAVSTIPNLVSLAPLRVSAGGDTTKVEAIGTVGGCMARFALGASCTDTGQVQLGFAVTPVSGLCGVGASQVVTLTAGAPITSQIAQLGSFSFAWAFDGKRAVIFGRAGTLAGTGSGLHVDLSAYASNVFFPSAGYLIQQGFPNGGPVSFFFERLMCPPGTLSAGMLPVTWSGVGVTDPVSPGQCLARAGDGAFVGVGPGTWGLSQSDPGVLPAAVVFPGQATFDVTGR